MYWAGWLLAASLIALQVPDILTTNWILAAGGRELNPIIRWVMRLGKLWWVPKLVITAVVAAYLGGLGEESTAVLIGLNIVYVAVIISNIRQMRRIKARRRLACLVMRCVTEENI